MQPADLADRIAAFALESAGVSPEDPAAVRALPVERLVEVEARMSNPATANPELGLTPFEPIVDGRVIPGPPIDAVRGGSAAGIDILVGSTLDEYKPYGETFEGLEDMDHATVVAAAAAEYGRIEGRDLTRDIEALAKAYRDARTAKGLSVDPGDLYLVLEGDRNFWMQGVLAAEAQTPHPGRVFHYVFTWESPWRDGAFGAYHGLDSGFVFGTIDATNSRAQHGEGPRRRRPGGVLPGRLAQLRAHRRSQRSRRRSLARVRSRTEHHAPRRPAGGRPGLQRPGAPCLGGRRIPGDRAHVGDALAASRHAGHPRNRTGGQPPR